MAKKKKEAPWTERRMRARANYSCCLCKSPITVGAEYYRHCTVTEDGFLNEKLCAGCAASKAIEFACSNGVSTNRANGVRELQHGGATEDLLIEAIDLKRFGAASAEAWREWFADSGAAARWNKVDDIEAELGRGSTEEP